MTKHVYTFGGDRNEGNASMRNLLGGKGCNLAEMAGLGIPVPPGFTVTTDVCTLYNQAGKQLPADVVEQIKEALKWLEGNQGRTLGNAEKPLLLSVRSGARDSMPGMMDTVLNLGLNDATVEGLAKASNNPRFAYDSYRRFIMMYSDVVLDVHKDHFEEKIEELKHKTGKKLDTEITAEEWKQLCGEFKAIVKAKLGRDFPQDPWEQLLGGIRAVFNSWDTERAIIYRRMNKIPDEWGTAVNVQTMVFGNMGDDCGTGVAFTRDPGTGEPYFYGEYLINAQGEDVVAGIRTPQPITKYQAADSGLKSLEEVMPDVYKELYDTCQKLEKHFKNMQDLEFTIQQGRLYMLQTRNGKRTALAGIRIALDMVKEGMIDEQEGLKRLNADDLTQLLAPIFDAKEKAAFKKAGKMMAKGLPAGPGAAVGLIALSAEEAVALAEKEESLDPSKRKGVVLVRIETSPEDLAGMVAAKGILTARGGMTSHAAVVARGMGKPCVCGASSLVIDVAKRTVSVGDIVLKAGEDFISIDGSAGEIYAGKLSAFPSEVNQVLVEKTLKPEASETFQRFAQIMEWSNKYRALKVRTNADTPHDAAVARAFGAQGIGLCRTEHMFFEDERIPAVREFILAKDEEARKAAVIKLLPYQRKDFEGIFTAMNGLPVTVRLLDPPLHEFVPHDEKGQAEMAKVLGVTIEEVKHRVEKLHEFNPMMGHRGCRLGITYPELIRMQMRAIAEAAINVSKQGVKAMPEVMVPLIGTVKELKFTKDQMLDEIAAVNKENGTDFMCPIGTMIEIPRAAITADKVAEEAEFFSFGTNDLTQMGFGYSRDDSGSFLPEYVSKKILEDDPFQSLDQEGIGELVRIACEKGRKTRPDIKLGVCGEHGGDPRSVKFFHRTGLAYVSCSPYRVPVAILAAAQAVLEEKK
ncbi:pyruvate, phosphate dikinase [Mesoterricola sediminis]|uniref:Pyruvate, phosphate dikinase n=1 Tax=Mesoterricola sediminis TaxID=2927980 RepID=A0AA48KEJ8_9BACT|nr:pyruvate, phosphate dikinase [Mesoterricola sediminis]BDU77377.1 pyruvate, phosphate dikinase [Mesoterricola sediminis]